MTMFCSEFIKTKTFKPIKTRRHWTPIWFHIFFSKGCFSSFTPGVFLIRFYFFLIPRDLGYILQWLLTLNYHFKAIAWVIYLVGKFCKSSLAKLADFLKLLLFTAIRMIVHHLFNFVPTLISFKNINVQ